MKKILLTYQGYLKSANHRSRVDTGMGISLEDMVDIPKSTDGPRVNLKDKVVGSPILRSKPLTSTPENSCASGSPDLKSVGGQTFGTTYLSRI